MLSKITQLLSFAVVAFLYVAGLNTHAVWVGFCLIFWTLFDMQERLDSEYDDK